MEESGTVEEETVELYIVNNSRNPMPAYKTEQSSGMDLYADIGGLDEVIINPGEISLIGTGISVVIPDGYEGQIRSRSGLALKSGIIVLNSPGTIKKKSVVLKSGEFRENPEVDNPEPS